MKTKTYSYNRTIEELKQERKEHKENYSNGYNRTIEELKRANVRNGRRWRSGYNRTIEELKPRVESPMYMGGLIVIIAP